MGVFNCWQDYFHSLLKITQLKQKLIKQLNIAPITLHRWATKKNIPNDEKLRGLLEALPEYQEDLLKLIHLEKPDFQLHPITPPEITTSDIPHTFYVRTFHALATSSLDMRTESLCLLIIQQIVSHLDPLETGLSCSIMQCLPPMKPEYQVQSLHFVTGRSSANWATDLSTLPRLCGIESQEGYTASHSQARITNNRLEKGFFYDEFMPKDLESTATFPINRFGKVAGCLSISSIHPSFFSHERQSILRRYTNLLTLAFSPCDFYSPEEMNLQYFPPPIKQFPQTEQLQERIYELLQHPPSQQPLTRPQARYLAWHEMEQLILEMDLV